MLLPHHIPLDGGRRSHVHGWSWLVKKAPGSNPAWHPKEKPTKAYEKGCLA
jgi:hypothetical protein